MQSEEYESESAVVISSNEIAVNFLWCAIRERDRERAKQFNGERKNKSINSRDRWYFVFSSKPAVCNSKEQITLQATCFKLLSTKNLQNLF